jgi:hypothetical protein
MPAYNFKAQFAPAVEAGQKLCTIRGKAAKLGTTAYLYTGMRTKACRKLGQGKIINNTAIRIGYEEDRCTPRFFYGAIKIAKKDFLILAKSDGFDSCLEMVNFFSDTYKTITLTPGGGADVFSGFMITWELDK